MKRRSMRDGTHAVTDGCTAFVVDQLEELAVTPRRMFGGVGLYARGVFFGLLSKDVLYLKVDDRTRPEYEAAGMKPFRPYPGQKMTFGYYAVPIEVLESAPEAVAWAKKAIGVAESAGGSARRTRVGRRHRR